MKRRKVFVVVEKTLYESHHKYLWRGLDET